MVSEKKIMIVDDEPITTLVMSARIQELGAEVLSPVTHIDEAVSRAAMAEPALVLINLLQVAAVGVETVEAVRRLFKVPVVFYASQVEQCRRLGLTAHEFVRADADVRELAVVFNAALKMAELMATVAELEARITDSRVQADAGALARQTAHSFNNILMAVMSGVALARLDIPEGTAAHAQLDKVEAAVERGAELCRELLGRVRAPAPQEREIKPPTAASEHSHAEPVAAAVAGARPRGAIMIVDDDDAVRALAKWVVEKAGYTAITARDGDEALVRFKTDPGAVGLVLLDLTMPRVSGEEVLVGMRAIRPNVCVVIITGHGEEFVREGEREGVMGFLQKPFSPDALRGMLANYAARCG